MTCYTYVLCLILKHSPASNLKWAGPDMLAGGARRDNAFVTLHAQNINNTTVQYTLYIIIYYYIIIL